MPGGKYSERKFTIHICSFDRRLSILAIFINENVKKVVDNYEHIKNP